MTAPCTASMSISGCLERASCSVSRLQKPAKTKGTPHGSRISLRPVQSWATTPDPGNPTLHFGLPADRQGSPEPPVISPPGSKWQRTSSSPSVDGRVFFHAEEAAMSARRPGTPAGKTAVPPPIPVARYRFGCAHCDPVVYPPASFKGQTLTQDTLKVACLLPE